MAPNTSIVDINGNKYDTKTGKLLTGQATAKAVNKATPKGLVMDGVVRRPVSKPSPTPAKSSSVTYKQGSIVKQAPAKNAQPAKNVHSRLSRSTTLIRGAQKKPVAPKPIHSKSKVPKPAITTTTQPHNISKVDESRLGRAKTISKSTLIAKFSAGTFQPKTSINQAEPKALQGEVMTNSIKAEPTTQPMPSILPSTVATSTHGNIDELVDRALAVATAHKEQKPKKRVTKPKIVSAMAMVLFVFLIAGFFAYQYIPNFAMRVASQRAGIDASLPNYQPSGFSFESINTTPGTVVVSYQSNTNDNRLYTVKQKGSSWDSQTLLSNFVKYEDRNYQQDTSNAGRVMYIYDKNNATWVSGGIWYIVEGEKANLTVDQLTKIASSL